MALQIEENGEVKIITLPETLNTIEDYTITQTFPKRRDHDYLPNEIWHSILQFLPNSSKLLCKFVSHDWCSLLKNWKTEKIDIKHEYIYCDRMFYFRELVTAYGIHNVIVDQFVYNDMGVWLINKGAKFTESALKSAIHANNYELVNSLLQKGCTFSKIRLIYTDMVTVNKDIIVLLTKYNKHIYT